MAMLNGVHSLSGNLNSNNAGTIEGGTVAAGTVVKIGPEWQKVSHLSATVTVDAETNGITLTPVWQVSNDGTTWVQITPSNHAANVVMATGTAGSDAAVTAVISAPPGVYGWKFARVGIKNLVQTGTANDTYTISYNYRQLTGMEKK